MITHGNSSGTNRILERVRGTEPRALVELFARHKERLRRIVRLRLAALREEHLGEKAADVGPEVSLYRGALPEVNSVSLAAQLLGQATSATQAAARADMQIRLQEALNAMDPLDREIVTLCHFEDL